MTRDKNDARVTFVKLADRYGLTPTQINALWRVLQHPYPETSESS